MKSLSDVAEYGKGSAARPLTRRTDRIFSRKALRLIAVSIAAGTIALVAAHLVVPARGADRAQATDASDTDVAVVPHPPTASPTPTMGTGYPAVSPSQPRLEYAITLGELRGLPLDVAPGTDLELWVSWDDAFADGPQVQRLIKRVSLARMIAPVTPEGPAVAVLSVPESSLGDLVYGDRYGTFAVAVPVN